MNKELIKEFIEELDVFDALLKLGSIKEAKCQRDRVIETFKEALKANQEDLLKKIEGRIEENNKWKNEKGICGVCMEDDYCFHDIENQALEDIKKLIEI